MKRDYRDFTEIVWRYYDQHSRDLPWRRVDGDGVIDPYHILVSEIMLQQTQAQRVVPKYVSFLAAFPDIRVLANSSLERVLAEWSGLGYNRRAKFLWQAANYITESLDGKLPADEPGLVALPGVGINTARAVLAYAFNQPVAFIETNIRTVFIYHFFKDELLVDDKAILALVSQTVDKEHPREWYWALMDYGTHLKQTVGNASRSSRHYTKQSTFTGSRRQIRGRIIKLLVTGPKVYEALKHEIGDERFEGVVEDLVSEGLIKQADKTLHL